MRFTKLSSNVFRETTPFIYLGYEGSADDCC